ncbi:c-type cytochrome [Roseovarius aestuariivivens]|uniref:c-type cytochrome n=1 Tax=Roseovarius aestuariivivens TaxID=1888910 RepID=UPI0010807502|nr:cytochrome c [Roseovarius aestuariivivens]
MSVAAPWTRRAGRLGLLPLAFAVSGCLATPEPDVSRAAGAALFAEHCAACHGADGHGGGPVAAGLATAPADLTKIAQRRGGVWPMLEVMSILDGYAMARRPRADMPVIDALTEGPTVAFDSGNGVERPTPARLVALAEYLESLQSPRPVRYVP